MGDVMNDAENSILDDTEMDRNTDITYICPDTLTCDQLVHELRKRTILRSNKDHYSFQKEHLVCLFKKYVVPLPQREQYKKAIESHNPGEMLTYIKSSSLKRKR